MNSAIHAGQKVSGMMEARTISAKSLENLFCLPAGRRPLPIQHFQSARIDSGYQQEAVFWIKEGSSHEGEHCPGPAWC